MLSWFNKQSLAFKLNISILSAVFVVFGALVWLFSNGAKHIVSDKIQEAGIQAVQSYAGNIEHLMTDVEQIVINTKNTLSQLPDDNIDSLKASLNSAIKTIDSSALSFTDAWVYVFEPEDVAQGTLYISSSAGDKLNFNARKITDFYSKFPWFKDVPKEEKIFWTKPYMERDSGKIVLTCLVPFMFNDSKDFDGLAALTVDLSDMAESIRSFSNSESGILVLISHEGLYVVHPDKSILLKKTIFELAAEIDLVQLETAGRKVLSGEVGTTNIPHSSIFDGAAIFFYAPVEKLNWGMFLVYSEDIILNPIRHIQHHIILPFILALLLLFFGINQICHHSTKQLLSLSKIADKYGKGDFSSDFASISAKDEIGTLATALSNMHKNLTEYIEKEKNDIKELQKNESELNIARNIQKAALSNQYPEHPSFDICTLMRPAKQVGGDFYDFFFIDEYKFAVVVADVSEKGVPAALFMMKSQALLKNVAKSRLPLEEVFAQVNNELCEGNESCMFVSAFMAVVDLNTGYAEYINAGHTPPLLYNGEKYGYLHPKTNVVLGVKKDAQFVKENITLAPEHRLFIYTDGVTEAKNDRAEFYGEKRLQKVLGKKLSTPENTLNSVLQDIEKFARGCPQSDDITMLEFVFLKNLAQHLKIKADNANLAEVLRFITDNMRALKVPPQCCFKAASAAEEIFVNVADYAYGAKKTGWVDISTKLEGNLYTITFVDSGKKFNPLKQKAPDLNVPSSEREPGGWGILLTKKMADTLEYAYINRQNVLKIGILLS